MIDYPNSLREFEASFPDDEACARWLSAKRWPEGFTCRGCGYSTEGHLCHHRYLLSAWPASVVRSDHNFTFVQDYLWPQTI